MNPDRVINDRPKPANNNPPFRVINLDEDLFELLKDHCRANISQGMAIIQNSNDLNMGEPELRKLVELIERFQKLRRVLLEAEK